MDILAFLWRVGIMAPAVHTGAMYPNVDACRAKEHNMKYLFAWMLGVPGGLIAIWFLFNHMH
jgi:hypothetical protein